MTTTNPNWQEIPCSNENEGCVWVIFLVYLRLWLPLFHPLSGSCFDWSISFDSHHLIKFVSFCYLIWTPHWHDLPSLPVCKPAASEIPSSRSDLAVCTHPLSGTTGLHPCRCTEYDSSTTRSFKVQQPITNKTVLSDSSAMSVKLPCPHSKYCTHIVCNDGKNAH